MLVILVDFASILLEHERMVKIQMVHGCLRDYFPLFVIYKGVFKIYDFK